jgi:hypothetical protein
LIGDKSRDSSDDVKQEVTSKIPQTDPSKLDHDVYILSVGCEEVKKDVEHEDGIHNLVKDLP